MAFFEQQAKGQCVHAEIHVGGREVGGGVGMVSIRRGGFTFVVCGAI